MVYRPWRLTSRPSFGLLLRIYSFRSVSPYVLADWAALLICARLGSDLFVPRFLFDLGEEGEVQFVYRGSMDQESSLGDKLPMVRAIKVKLPRGHTREQARRLLATKCQRPLAFFLRQIRPLAKEMFAPSFDVRIITFLPTEVRRVGSPDDPSITRIYLPNPISIESINGNFTVELRRGRHLSNMMDEITDRLLPALEVVAAYTAAQGRPPDVADDAAWWAMTVFDGLTVEQIADKISDSSPNAADLDERIARALRRLGMSLRTK